MGAATYKLVLVLVSTFLVLWYTSFADEGIITEDESKRLYQRALVISTILNLISAPFLGMIGDSIPARVLIPVSFGLRAIFGYMFLFVHDPESIYAYTLICLVGLTSGLQVIAINVLFYSTLPSKLRGTMTGFFMFFGTMGKLIFALIGGYMFDKIGRNSPILLQSAMDTLVVVLALSMICMGKLQSK